MYDPSTCFEGQTMLLNKLNIHIEVANIWNFDKDWGNVTTRSDFYFQGQYFFVDFNWFFDSSQYLLLQNNYNPFFWLQSICLFWLFTMDVIPNVRPFRSISIRFSNKCIVMGFFKFLLFIPFLIFWLFYKYFQKI